MSDHKSQESGLTAVKRVLDLPRRALHALTEEERARVDLEVARLLTRAEETADRGEWRLEASYGRWLDDADYDVNAVRPGDGNLYARALAALGLCESTNPEVASVHDEIAALLARAVRLRRRRMLTDFERLPDRLAMATAAELGGLCMGVGGLKVQVIIEGDWVTIYVTWGAMEHVVV